MESLGGLEVADVQRVFPTLPCQCFLACCQGRIQEGIAVGGKDDFPRAEVERNDADMFAVDGETVDDAICDVLLAHGFNHVRQDGWPCQVVTAEFLDGMAFCQQPTHLDSPLTCQYRLAGLGILQQLRLLWVSISSGRRGQGSDESLTVAHHPYFSIQPTEDDGRTGQPVFWVFCQSRQHVVVILFAEISGNATQKLVAGRRLCHLTDIAGSQQHGITAIRTTEGIGHQRTKGVLATQLIAAFRGAAVDDSYKVRGDDDAVFAGLFRVLGDEVLFEDLHESCESYGLDGYYGCCSGDRAR